MSEHELNQYLDWEDKCYEATMDKITDKLSSEQRDWIKNWCENKVLSFPTVVEFADALVKFLNANTTEDEPCLHNKGRVSNDVCTWCAICGQSFPETDNQIALRKKGEFIKDWYQDWVDKKVAWCPEDPTFDDFEKWLQQEEEDE